MSSRRRWRFKEFALDPALTSTHTLASQSRHKTQQEELHCEGTLIIPDLGSPDSHPSSGGTPSSHLAHTKEILQAGPAACFSLEIES